MAKYRFHKIAAVAVLIASAAWIATGEFSSVGGAASEAEPQQKQATEAPAKPLRTVGVIHPDRVQHARAIRLSGRTEADKRVELATRAAGIIAELPLKQGDRVEAGQVLLRLDAEEKQAAVETARQLVVQREAEATATERLLKSGTVGKLQGDNVRTALLQAKSQLEMAQAELGRLEVKAPFTGLVDKVSVEEGASIQPGSPVATLISLDPVIASGEVSERNLGSVRVGDSAEVQLVSGERAEGTIRYISRDATAATRTYRVEVAVPNPEFAIPAGMTCEIVLRTRPVESVVLPRSVVTLSGDGDLGIRAVDAQDKVTFHPIDLVDDTPEGLVLGGIPADARIIVQGQEFVTEGETVKAVAADEKALKELAGEAAGETN